MKPPACGYNGWAAGRAFANAGSLRDVELAKKHGAEGIGLFRSEVFIYGKQPLPDRAGAV